MSSRVPTVKQIAWISLLPQLLVMAFLIFVAYQLHPKDGIIFGTLAYLIISFSLRILIPKHHRIGMKKVKTEDFENAIPDFENSYDFFTKYDWVDKYRYFTLLSSSQMSYKEMALNNIAFCYGQMGNGIKSKEYYERTLKEYPNSGIAKAGLRLLNSMAEQRDN